MAFKNLLNDQNIQNLNYKKITIIAHNITLIKLIKIQKEKLIQQKFFLKQIKKFQNYKINCVNNLNFYINSHKI